MGIRLIRSSSLQQKKTGTQKIRSIVAFSETMAETISCVTKARKLIFASVTRKDLGRSTDTLKMALRKESPIKIRTSSWKKALMMATAPMTIAAKSLAFIIRGAEIFYS